MVRTTFSLDGPAIGASTMPIHVGSTAVPVIFDLRATAQFWPWWALTLEYATGLVSAGEYIPFFFRSG